MAKTTLIVEDDGSLQSSLVRSFEKRGYEVLAVATVADATQCLRERSIALVLLDIRLPDGSGFDVLSLARDVDPEIPVIIMTAFPEVRTAVRAMKEGARDFVIKPFELEELHLTVERALEARELKRNVARLERERQSRGEITELLGESQPLARLREEIHKVAASSMPVLVVGPTGTGKELVANSVHRLSERARGPLVKVNCSAFSEQILESELFGHEKGAFTDAREARAGLFEMSDGGTLFLDEISEMNPGLQAKLLRVVEGHPFRRVGGQRNIQTDVRIIAASNRNLERLLQSGKFREDLYFRLNAFQIVVPPLRERGEDIVLLARFFLRRCARDLRKEPIELTMDAENLLRAYPWPGNVRELRNVIERAAILCDTGQVAVEHLPGQLQASAFTHQVMKKSASDLPSLKEVEQRYMRHVLEQTGGNLSETARILGISRNTLKARIQS